MPGVWTEFGIDFSGFNKMLDLRHCDLAGCRHHRIEVARRFAIDEIAFGIALIGVNNGDIGDKSAFHDIGRAVEFAQFLPLGNECADASLCEKRRNAGPACSDSLGERALRVKFEFKLAGKILPLEKLVLADIRRDHFFDLPRLEKNAQTGAVDACVVRDHGQILDLEIMNGLDQDLRDAAKSKTSRHESHAVLEKIGQGRACIGKNLVHAWSSLAGFLAASGGVFTQSHRLPVDLRALTARV